VNGRERSASSSIEGSSEREMIDQRRAWALSFFLLPENSNTSQNTNHSFSPPFSSLSCSDTKILVSSLLVVTDADGGNFDKAIIDFGFGFIAGDVLSFEDTATITAAFVTGTGELTLSGLFDTLSFS
jgi:hypothetical protein